MRFPNENTALAKELAFSDTVAISAGRLTAKGNTGSLRAQRSWIVFAGMCEVSA